MHAQTDIYFFPLFFVSQYNCRVIWVILILELIFEIMIRPKDYWQLIRSDKAYRPSTARYINQLYVVGEAIALITYIPEIACINKTTDVCLSRGFFEKFTLIQASASAVLGPTQADSLFGRIVMGSMALRFFGVIRHWKQMLINQTFRPTKREGIEKWVIPYDPNNDLQKRTRRRIEQNEDVSSGFSFFYFNCRHKCILIHIFKFAHNILFL